MLHELLDLIGKYPILIKGPFLVIAGGTAFAVVYRQTRRRKKSEMTYSGTSETQNAELWAEIEAEDAAQEARRNDQPEAPPPSPNGNP